MRKRISVRQCLWLTACWMVLAVSASAQSVQTGFTEGAGRPDHANSGAAELQPPPEPRAQAQAPGEQQPQPQGEPKPGEQKKKAEENHAQGKTSHDRMFFLMPNFLTLENASKAPPLTPGQKFKGVARGTFDPFQFAYYGLLVGIGQATDSEHGYGQGAAGYGKRYAAIFGDTTIENFMVGAVLPSLLRQDPRYFQKGKGGFARRTWYAMTRVFVICGDSGHEQFNASEIFGSAISAGISTYSYHPESDRKIGNVTATWGAQLGSDVFGNMMKEFWPDIRRHFSKERPAR
jgi:hypothetical protein